MTVQLSERLLFQGTEFHVNVEPLEQYFALGGKRPGFAITSTDLWRGYVGTWEINAGRLYLIGLSGILSDGRSASLDDVFPGFASRVFAHWFSGELIVPQDPVTGYACDLWPKAIHSSDIVISIESGVVSGTSVYQAPRRPHEGALRPRANDGDAELFP